MKAILDTLSPNGPGMSPWDITQLLNSERPENRQLEVDFVTEWLKEYGKRGAAYRVGNFWWLGKRPI